MITVYPEYNSINKIIQLKMSELFPVLVLGVMLVTPFIMLTGILLVHVITNSEDSDNVPVKLQKECVKMN